MNITEQPFNWGVNIGAGYNCFIVRKKDFISQGIQWFSRWNDLPNLPVPSHAFIATGPDFTIEAFGDGVHTGTFANYLNDQNSALLVRKPKNWTPELGSAIVGAATKHLGEKYGYFLIAGMALSNSFLGKGLDKITGGWTTRKLDSMFDNSSTDICSELVAKSDVAAGMTGGILLKPADTIKPIDLFTDQVIYEPDAIELLA